MVQPGGDSSQIGSVPPVSSGPGGYSVTPAHLETIAGLFGDASSDVTYWRGLLAGEAQAAGSSKVIGSDQAAAEYSRVFEQWMRNLAQLASSLETMALKMSATAANYAQAESASTVNPAP